MKRSILSMIAIALSTASAFAGAKTYQVTGPVVEVRPDVIVVDKAKEGKWEINRTADQGADLKVGDKVTIKYTMAVSSIEVKAAEAAKDAKAKGKKK